MASPNAQTAGGLVRSDRARSAVKITVRPEVSFSSRSFRGRYGRRDALRRSRDPVLYYRVGELVQDDLAAGKRGDPQKLNRLLLYHPVG
jgi:hypothetical protein